MELGRKFYMLCVVGVQYTNNFWQLLQAYSVLNFWACIHMDMYTKDTMKMVKGRSHVISHAIWACYFYPVAVGTLPAAPGVMYKSFKLLLLS